VRDQRLHIVTTPEPELLARLQTGYLGRATVHVTTADDRGLAHLVAESQPHVIIVGGPPEAGRDHVIAAAVRASAPAGLLLRALPLGATAPRDPGPFDGVIPVEDLEAALATRLPPTLVGPVRHGTRTPVAVPALLSSDLGITVPATTIDLSSTGTGLRTERPVPYGAVLNVLFHRPDGRRVGLCGEVVWVAPAPGQRGARVGVQFMDESPATLRALFDLALWEVAGEGAGATLRLYGRLDGRQDLAPLAAVVLDVRRIDLDGIGAVTTAGTAGWLRFLRTLPLGVIPHLVNVPAPLAAGLRCAADLEGRFVLESCYVAWTCLSCELEVSELALPDGAPARPRCPACEGRMRPVHRGPAC
jgi:hypothetical protein